MSFGTHSADRLRGDRRRRHRQWRGHFAADKAWWFITLLTVGYLVSRGLAKAGSRSSDTDPRTDPHDH